MLAITRWRHIIAARICLLLIGVLFWTGCPDSKIEVHRVMKDMPKDQKKMKGVFYALPRTLVLIKIPVTRTDKLPGKYENFARCFFPDGADRRVTKASTEFEVGDEITFDAKGEPDPHQIFIVNTKAGLFQTKSLTMAYTEDGVLSDAKAETKDETIDFALSAFKTLASIGGAISGIRGLPTSNELGFRERTEAARRLVTQLKQAQDLKARTEMRKCYNNYVTATATSTRRGANLLQQAIEAIKAAGGREVNYDDASLIAAEDTAKRAVIANNRAAELVDEAITLLSQLPPDDSSSPDNPLAPSAGLEEKPQHSGTGQKALTKTKRKVSEPDQVNSDAEKKPKPLKEAEEQEKRAVELANQVIANGGLVQRAYSNLSAAYDEAKNIYDGLPESPGKSEPRHFWTRPTRRSKPPKKQLLRHGSCPKEIRMLNSVTLSSPVTSKLFQSQIRFVRCRLNVNRS